MEAVGGLAGARYHGYTFGGNRVVQSTGEGISGRVQGPLCTTSVGEGAVGKMAEPSDTLYPLRAVFSVAIATHKLCSMGGGERAAMALGVKLVQHQDLLASLQARADEMMDTAADALEISPS